MLIWYVEFRLLVKLKNFISFAANVYMLTSIQPKNIDKKKCEFKSVNLIDIMNKDTKVETWYDRSSLTLGNYGSLYASLDRITGDCVFGTKKGKTKEAYKLLCDYMHRTEKMECFLMVMPGKIITIPPSEEEMMIKLKEQVNRLEEYYKQQPYTQVTDLWAGGSVHEGEPLDKNIPYHKRLLERKEPRFKGKIANSYERVTELINTSDGMLCEGHVIAHLNKCFTCQECKIMGKIGWCDGITHRSVDGFRDATCMGCREMGVITVFEIKTRWESAIKKNKDPGTYAGSFAAINALKMLRANVYLIIASRDTGNIRVGKITSMRIRGNKNWLYSLQEGYEWGAPSSYVSCKNGLNLLSTPMPPLINVDKIIKNVIKKVLELQTNSI